MISPLQRSSHGVESMRTALLQNRVVGTKGEREGNRRTQNLVSKFRYYCLNTLYHLKKYLSYFWQVGKVIYPRYSKHWPYTVASTIDCGCIKILNHGLNHRFFLLHFKLKPCPIHWIVCVLAYSNFIFEF